MAEKIYEKLGAFYLGRLFDESSGETSDELMLYDSGDLTTHAVCVGMTGSGKTGLCVTLLEEAAIDSIPAIALDMKGDLGNVLLTFPRLAPGDFLPWIDEAEAVSRGLSVRELAAKTASNWKEGLARWGQDPSRIAALREAVDLSIYTPGSSAGRQISLMGTFTAPPRAIVEDDDLFRDRVLGSVSGLLALLGMEADPVRSREHIFLSTLLTRAWRNGRDLDLAGLIGAIQSPPFKKIGILDVDSVFPEKARFELAMTLNNILASPSFAAWLKGERLDIQKLLWTAEGKPRLSVVSLAHLSGRERMFFVTMLLNELVGWMRRQSGTASLRALLLFDEVFGFLPPTANPPSKVPLLTLLKQARAFGLGLLLATQNPVDLDYKALSNAGTWFLGRLQTERDKMRVLEGIEGVAAASGGDFDRKAFDSLLSGLKKRVFLVNNVHEDRPVLFKSRWALSYLRGPMTRKQVKLLSSDRGPSSSSPTDPLPGSDRVSVPPQLTHSPAPPLGAGRSLAPPALPSGISQLYIQPDDLDDLSSTVYRPFLMGRAEVHFINKRVGLDEWKTLTFLAPLCEESVKNPWDGLEALDEERLDFGRDALPGIMYSDPPASSLGTKITSTWKRTLKRHVYKNERVRLFRCRAIKMVSVYGEKQSDFMIRLRQAVREKRDHAVAVLRKKYASKLKRIQEKIAAARRRLDREQAQYSQQQAQTYINIGATVLGALFGRRTLGRAARSASSAARAAREQGDIQLARARLSELSGRMNKLEFEFKNELVRLKDKISPENFKVEEMMISPRKADTMVTDLSIVWRPSKETPGAVVEPDRRPA